jgi:hypothetical protein
VVTLPSLDTFQDFREAAGPQSTLARRQLWPASPERSGVDVLLDEGIPVVTIDRRLSAAPVERVMVNNRAAMR